MLNLTPQTSGWSFIKRWCMQRNDYKTAKSTTIKENGRQTKGLQKTPLAGRRQTRNMVRPIMFFIRGSSGLVLSHAEYSLHVYNHEDINAMLVKKSIWGFKASNYAALFRVNATQKSQKSLKSSVMYFNTLTIPH
jgi:hypothetical protein